MEENQSINQSDLSKYFNQLPPKLALLVGLIGGFLVLCTIGFFVLLSMVLKGTVPTVKSNSAGAPVVQAPTAQGNEPIGQAPTGTVPPLTAKDHVRGDKNAPLTLIEYSDFECPFCKRFHPTVLQVLEQYKGKVKVVFRHYPLSFHANAQKEAEATECAAELGGNDAFWSFHDKIFERTNSNGYGFALDQLAPLAKEIGLNEAKFKSCLDSGKYASVVTDQMNAGAAAGVQGTPGSFLIGKDGAAQLISGAVPFEQLKAAIDAQL